MSEPTLLRVSIICVCIWLATFLGVVGIGVAFGNR